MPDLMGMKNILVLNDEAHHCYREKPSDADDEDLKGDEQEGGREEQRGRPALDLRPRSGEPQARPHPRHRPVGDAVLPARLRLRRRHAVPLDDERLLADGRHRVRHRQAAARAGGRQHPRRRDADVPQPVGAHPQGHAEEGPRQGRRARPAQAADPAADRARGPLRPLREDLRALGRTQASRCRRASSSSANNTAISKLVYDYISGFHREERGRHRPRSRTAASRCSATSTRHGNPLPGRNTLLIDSEQLEAGDALDDNFREHGRRRDRALPPRDHRAHRRPRARPRTSPTRNCCARS